MCSVSPRDASGSEMRALTRKTPAISSSTAPHWEERFEWPFFFPLVEGVEAESPAGGSERGSGGAALLPPPPLPRTVVLKVKDTGGGARLGTLRIGGMSDLSLGEVVVLIGADMVHRAVQNGGVYSVPRQFYPLQRRRKMAVGKGVAGELRVGVTLRIPALKGDAPPPRASAFESATPMVVVPPARNPRPPPMPPKPVGKKLPSIAMAAGVPIGVEVGRTPAWPEAVRPQLPARTRPSQLDSGSAARPESVSRPRLPTPVGGGRSGRRKSAAARVGLEKEGQQQLGSSSSERSASASPRAPAPPPRRNATSSAQAPPPPPRRTDPAAPIQPVQLSGRWQSDVGTSSSASEKEHDEHSLRAAFDHFDVDGSGDIDVDELQTLLFSLGVTLDEKKCAILMEKIDTDGNGTLDFEEFQTAMHMEKELGLEARSKKNWVAKGLLTAKLSSKLAVHRVGRLARGAEELLAPTVVEVDASGAGDDDPFNRCGVDAIIDPVEDRIALRRLCLVMQDVCGFLAASSPVPGGEGGSRLAGVGLFRVPGNGETVGQMFAAYSRDATQLEDERDGALPLPDRIHEGEGWTMLRALESDDPLGAPPGGDAVNAVASLLKKAFRTLVNPLVPFEVYKDFLGVRSMSATDRVRRHCVRPSFLNRPCELIHSPARLLPPSFISFLFLIQVVELRRIFFGFDESETVAEGASRAPLIDDVRRGMMQRLLAFLQRLLSYEASNSMTPRNVAICFAPSVIQPPASVSVMQAAMQVGITIDVLEALLHVAAEVFPGSNAMDDGALAAEIALLRVADADGQC